ncbi:MAG: SDR family NAD(P)-dependent oxidoreductase [Rhodospirillaceae bacterium]|nr:SDR family NAD(P)-dependent oxidoreductase [Rhodospirillaceae bacterium]MBT5191423.1 SDR family NAD(P)-dependent oxidoreductase [Rhodospirillaceae bacterium]MBT5895078.1 SDR family NAD(P)-dependent oxidoreductase [Rhodospirillaceae bacterium]MBT6427791.1 SDR family NAD(P)-dependent oxidoreductase [Rhodospirillaceae bacterium]MBT7757484.1 SDR family NAD(P)-dependent oxidoreductase [Rhodospirillaceae bacterium]
MQDFQGRTAFVTGAASGIGLGMARALLDQGANVMLADVEADALAATMSNLASADNRIDSVVCDVADAGAVSEAAQRTFDRFGNVHVVCNNAGIGAGGMLEDVKPETWQWVIGVNLMGVLHGIQAFLPHMKAHGEPSHVVNTASIAGMITAPGMGPYCATKFAVVAMTEVLALELEGSAIGASVLCPMWVRTRIQESDRNRPEALRNPVPEKFDPARREEMAQAIENGMDPAEVADRVLDAIRANRVHIFTHPETRALTQDRFDGIMGAFDAITG